MSVSFRSIFAQLLQFLPQDEFDALVRKRKHDAISAVLNRCLR